MGTGATTPVRVNPGRAMVRSANTVLSARTCWYHEPGFRTTLSIKSVTSGVAQYATRRGRYRVEPDTFALLNRGQEYTLDIQTRAATETCAAFFAPGFVEAALDATQRSITALLDDPFAPVAETTFVERLYPKTGAIARALAGLVSAARCVRAGQTDELGLEQGFHDLASALISLDRGVRQEALGFPGRRPSTRLELYRRLHRAHDRIQSCYAELLTIDSLARTATMAPHHFQHMYRRAFGRTPIQALQARRVEMARRWLAATDATVQEIALEVGFQSAPSFARLFRRLEGCSPSVWRSREPRRIGFMP